MKSDFERFFEKMSQKEAEKKALVSSFDYISWLEAFTQTYESFADDSWLYQTDEIEEADNQNVGKLSLFFKSLSEYCRRYYISVACDDAYEAERIHIKHNGVGYHFGLVTGQGAHVYVKREIPESDAIEFGDIVENVEPQNFEAKKDAMAKLELLVLEMKAMNIPIDAMLAIVNK